MARIALYGGAFNPPHLAHIFTVTYLLGRDDVDGVWLLPTADHVFGKALAPLPNRMEWLERVVCGLSWSDCVRVSGVEAEREGPSRTFDTLTVLSARYPEHSFVWVMGADNLTESHRWYRFDDLVAQWPMIVLGRPGHEAALDERAGEEWCRPGPALPSISSTQIRAALAGTGDAKHLAWVPDLIADEVRPHYAPRDSGSAGHVQVFGYGRAGASLSGGLKRAGYGVETWNRSPRAGVDTVGALPEIITAPVWLLCVDDGAITSLATQLAKRPDAQGRVVLHCAGRLGREALMPLAKVGCSTGSIHPLQSLRGRGDRLSGTYFAVEGAAAAMEAGSAMVEALGGHCVSLPAGGKAAYHAAAVLSANFATVLGAGGAALLDGLGVAEPTARAMLVPLLQGTVDHLTHAPAADALTGPFARRDWVAVSAHLEAIDRYAPQWRAAYTALARMSASVMDLSNKDRLELEARLSSKDDSQRP